MLPVLWAFGATVGSAITAREAAVIGAGIGAVGARMIRKRKIVNNPARRQGEVVNLIVMV